MQVRQAYGFNQISFTVGKQTVRGDGSGQTIAIVNAYDTPTIFSDVNVFDQAFSINGSQTLYQQYGSSSQFLTRAEPEGTPGRDPSGLWTIETELDVQWAHAIAPGAKILLVEAVTNSFTNLMNAVNYARNQPGVVVVSMSWGNTEFSGETGWDSYFTTPSGHLGGSNGLGGALLKGGVTFVAASGDHGAPATWPATAPNVLAVGGTSLSVSAAGNYLGEVAWSDSGGGYSTQEREPTFQRSVQTTGWRSAPDVAYNADPNNGFYVYTSLTLFGYQGWFQVGGTSAGSPQWAALIAIADQGRALQGKGSLDGPSQTLQAIYSLPAGDFHDITSGSNGYSAKPGYDPVTGRGSPVANLVVSGLVAYAGTASTSTTKSTTVHPSALTAEALTPALDAFFIDELDPTKREKQPWPTP
jgi:subtilase family serine protease